jgi:hypothetical protein
MENASGEAIYWLSKDSVKPMRGHVGRRVEVTASGRTDRPVEPGPSPSHGVKRDEKKTLPVHRVDVDTVKVIAQTCP